MNKLFYGDNLEILRRHVEDDSVDLIYIDPPFNSKRDYNIIYDGSTAQAQAFSDTWSLIGVPELEQMIFHDEAQRYQVLHRPLEGLKQILFHAPNAVDRSMYAYLVNMGVRLVEVHRKLKETGNFYLHCDPTASHYLKVLLDCIFGQENFRNEIIWCYRKWSVAAKQFASNHDIVFFYSKSRNNFFNVQYVEVSEGTKKRWKGQKQQAHFDEKGTRHASSLQAEQAQSPCPDWWQISIINPAAKERLGYPTQKPEALLERIIKSSCPPNGLVMDAYCGCGTTITVAQRFGMKWIGVDITYLAIDLIQQRLVDHFYLEKVKHPTKEQIEKARKKFIRDTEIFGIPCDMESARKLARETKDDYVRKEFEKWAVFSVNGVWSEKRGADGGVDGYFFIYDVDGKGKPAKRQGYIQVKSGKVGVKDIRDFDSTLAAFGSPLGIFVTLEEPTKSMLEYAASLPKYKSKLNNRTYDRITIITIRQILDEDVPDFAVRATKRAGTVIDEQTNGDLFLDNDD